MRGDMQNLNKNQNVEAQLPELTDAEPRLPYEPPTVETLGGTLSTLLASGCSPCVVCPPNPAADTP